jgi:hypothetical protein
MPHGRVQRRLLARDGRDDPDDHPNGCARIRGAWELHTVSVANPKAQRVIVQDIAASPAVSNAPMKKRYGATASGNNGIIVPQA